ncbi:hypothetical protein [Neisseria sp. Marseille-Q6792]|nr:hypothetical protein [Neisseria sp. Marseille-Q6792]
MPSESTAGWASAHRFHQSHISTVFIEYTESASFYNPALRN